MVLIWYLVFQAKTYIRAGEARRGSWGNFLECLAPARVNGFELKSEAITFDNTAANGLALYCDDSRMAVNGNPWGDWTGVEKCPGGTHICGYKTQIAVNLPQGLRETKINDI